MNVYEVVRPFSGQEAGVVMHEDEFASPVRAKQLVNMRYIKPVGEAGLQPTVKMLVATPIRQLKSTCARVEDACVLKQAVTTDERETAMKFYDPRLEELEPGESDGE